MKKVLCVTALLLAALLSLSACLSEPESDEPLADVYGEIKTSVTLADDFKDYKSLERDFGITDDMVEEFAGGHSTSGVNQEAIILVKAKDEDSAQQIYDKLKGYRDAKLNENKNYNAEQYAIIEKCDVIQSGRYYYLVISANADEIMNIINSHIKS